MPHIVSPVILVAGPPSVAPFLLRVCAALRANGTTVIEQFDGSPPATHPDWQRVTILVPFAVPCDAAALENAVALRAIVVPSLGYEGIDVDAATRLGIVVANGAVSENIESVAEAAIGLILMASYDIPAAEQRLRDNVQRAGAPRARMLRGKRVGLIGFGNIARQIARRLQGWGVTIQAYTRSTIPPDYSHVQPVSLDTLLETSDFILPLLPLTEETSHLLNRSRLLRAKQGSILVNLSRGAVIDETALAEPDVSARFSTIVLDVFESEPLSPESPLRRLPRAILTGHEIAHTAENLGALLDRAIENVREAATGRAPSTALNAKPGGPLYEARSS